MKEIENTEKWDKNKFADYFLSKAKYLSENIGGGENWNRSIFKDRIIDTLLDVADKVETQSMNSCNVILSEVVMHLYNSGRSQSMSDAELAEKIENFLNSSK